VVRARRHGAVGVLLRAHLGLACDLVGNTDKRSRSDALVHTFSLTRLLCCFRRPGSSVVFRSLSFSFSLSLSLALSLCVCVCVLVLTVAPLGHFSLCACACVSCVCVCVSVQRMPRVFCMRLFVSTCSFSLCGVCLVCVYVCVCVCVCVCV